MVKINREDQLFEGYEWPVAFIPEEYNWTRYCDNEWELLTCILLDTRTPLERLKKVVFALKEHGVLDYRRMSEFNIGMITNFLWMSGYPWYNQKAAYFGQDIDFDLKTATWEKIQTIRGIGPKLASLWCRILRGEEWPVIDSHVKRWMLSNGYEGSTSNYTEMSKWFVTKAAQLRVSVSDLDRRIVGEGIARRRGLMK